MFHTGAGTSHNMNANVVIANLAEESLGGRRGQYAKVGPNDHVNMAQSTNDVTPTALRLALLELTVPLCEELGSPTLLITVPGIGVRLAVEEDEST